MAWYKRCRDVNFAHCIVCGDVKACGRGVLGATSMIRHPRRSALNSGQIGALVLEIEVQVPEKGLVQRTLGLKPLKPPLSLNNLY